MRWLVLAIATFVVLCWTISDSIINLHQSRAQPCTHAVQEHTVSPTGPLPKKQSYMQSCLPPSQPNASELYWCPCQCRAVPQLEYAGRADKRMRRACADGTVERYRFLCSWFGAHPHLLTPTAHANNARRHTRGLGTRAVRVLHIAPERALARALGLTNNPHVDYVTGDFFVTPSATASGWVEFKIDLQAVPFPADNFDVVIVLHVLEHVPNASLAMQEIHRVLRPSGVAIIAVPDARSIATTLEGNFGMPPSERLRLYGQTDHLRRFGRDFASKLAAPGLSVKPVAIGDWYAKRPESKLFRNHEYDRVNHSFYYNELLFFAKKPRLPSLSMLPE